MEIRQMLDMMEFARKKYSANLKLGSMLDKLNGLPKDAIVRISMDFVKEYKKYISDLYAENEKELKNEIGRYDYTQFYFTGSWFSYRGYYCDMALGVSKTGKLCTVEELIEILNNATEKGVLEGYKGGAFIINNSTILWLATGPSDSTGIAAVDLIKLNDKEVLLTTKFIED